MQINFVTNFRFVHLYEIYGSTILSTSTKAFTKVSLKIWQNWRSYNTFWNFEFTPLTLILMTCQLGLCSCTETASFSCLPRHSCFSSVHLPTSLWECSPSSEVSSFLSYLSKCPLDKLLSQELDLQLWKVPSLFVKNFRPRRNCPFSLLYSPWFQRERRAQNLVLGLGFFFFKKSILFTLLWICFYSPHSILWAPLPRGTFKYPIYHLPLRMPVRANVYHTLLSHLFMAFRLFMVYGHETQCYKQH